jgi:hypothetical protein
MNPTQLFNNFYDACIYYAQSNGDDNVQFTLYDPGNQQVQITSWISSITPPVSQPTNTQLLEITLAEVATIARQQLIKSRLLNNILLAVTTIEITTYITNPPIGLMVFNTTLTSPQVWNGTIWQTIT